MPDDAEEARKRPRAAAPPRIRMAAPRRARRARAQRGGRALTSSRLFAAALVVLVAGVLMRPFFAPLAVVALALGVWGYYLAFTRSRAPGAGRRWRGEVVDFPESWPSKLRRWLGRR